MQSETILYFVRHGQTEWNVKRIMQGHLDSALTPKGIEQAKNVAQALSHIQFDLIYSSDLGRAKHTARIIAQKIKRPIQLAKSLREGTFGKHEGTTEEKYHELFEKRLLINPCATDQDLFHFKADTDIESPNDVMNRCMKFLRILTKKHTGKTILLVTHGGLIRHFLYVTGYKSYKELRFGAVKSTAYIKVHSNNGVFTVQETSGIIFSSDKS